MELNRISPGLFQGTNADGEAVLYTKVSKYSDGTAMTPGKADGIDFVAVGYEFFRRVASDVTSSDQEAGTLSEFSSGIGEVMNSSDNTFLSEL